MLFSSGLNFGMRRTIPHACGIAFGFGVLLAAVGFGLGAVLDKFPTTILLIKIFGGTYMVYLAWRILNSGPVEVQEGRSRPMKFYEAALFQWVNPKAWAMAAFAMATYTSEGNYAVNVGLVVIAFCAINFPSVTIWAGFGVAMRRFLQDPVKLKIFNVTMALALLASLWPMLSV